MSKAAYKKLYAAVRDILNDVDPVGLMELHAPSDEYDVEVSRLLPLLRECRSREDIQEIVTRMFSWPDTGELPFDTALEISHRIHDAVIESSMALRDSSARR